VASSSPSARDLVGAAQAIIDAPDYIRHRIHWVKRLVGIHLTRRIGVGGNLPAGQIDRLQPGLDLLHRLIAGQCAECGHKRLGLQQMPQPRGAHSRQCMADTKRAGQPLDVGGAVISANSVKMLRLHRLSFVANRGTSITDVAVPKTRPMC
jgi:hypothetical protein